MIGLKTERYNSSINDYRFLLALGTIHVDDLFFSSPVFTFNHMSMLNKIYRIRLTMFQAYQLRNKGDGLFPRSNVRHAINS